MPAVVRKRGKRWAIVNEDTGEVYGYSTSKPKAQASANARNASKHGWKATGQPARKKRK
jgi:hypothetical protein